MLAPLTFVQKERRRFKYFFFNPLRNLLECKILKYVHFAFLKNIVLLILFMWSFFFFFLNMKGTLWQVGSLWRGLLEGEGLSLLSVQNQDFPGEWKCTCLNLSSYKLCVGGGEYEHKGSLSRIVRTGASQPLRVPCYGLQPQRADRQIAPCSL